MIVKMVQFRGKLEPTAGSDESTDVVLSVRINDGRLVIDVYKNRFGATCADALGQLAEVRARAERLGSMLDLENVRLRDKNAAMLRELDAALARAADSDARLVRAIDAAKAAALAALTAPSPAGQLDALETILDFDPCCQCEPCEYFDDGLDSGDGLDAARKGRTTPSVRR